jgi:6-phosphogluconolactonase
LWEKVDVFWVDERLVERSNLESNAGNALKILGKLSSRFFPMFDADLGENRSLELYVDHLMTIDLINGIPSFDLILLGMGEDGHTASLFPSTEGLNELDEHVIIHDVPQLCKPRMTLTFPVLKQAQQIIILFHGEKKIKILNDLILNKGEYPIAKLLDTSANKIWTFYE